MLTAVTRRNVLKILWAILQNVNKSLAVSLRLASFKNAHESLKWLHYWYFPWKIKKYFFNCVVPRKHKNGVNSAPCACGKLLKLLVFECMWNECVHNEHMISEVELIKQQTQESRQNFLTSKFSSKPRAESQSVD